MRCRAQFFCRQSGILRYRSLFLAPDGRSQLFEVLPADPEESLGGLQTRSRATRSIAVHRPAATEPNDRSKTSTVALPSARASGTRHNASKGVRAISG